MHTFFRLRHSSLVTDSERRFLCFAGPDVQDPQEQPEAPDIEEAEDPAAVEQPEDAVEEGEARRDSAEEVAAKRRLELGMTNEDLQKLQLRARSMKGYKDGKVQLSDGSEVGLREYNAKDSQDAQKELRDLHRMGAITDAELPAKPQSTPVQPRAPKAGPKNAPPRDPVQLEADAQAKLLDDGKGGLVNWATLTAEEKSKRTATVQAEYGANVDEATGKVDVPADESQANLNRFGGALSQIGEAVGKWMEKMQGLFAKLSPNTGANAPANNLAAETRVKNALVTTNEPALRTNLTGLKTAAEADIQTYTQEVSTKTGADKVTAQTNLDKATKVRNEAAADLAALDTMVKTAEKMTIAINNMLTSAQGHLTKLKPINSLGDLPKHIRDIGANKMPDLKTKLIAPIGGNAHVADFHTELLKVMGKGADAALAVDGNGVMKNPSAYVNILTQLVAKAKKEQA